MDEDKLDCKMRQGQHLNAKLSKVTIAFYEVSSFEEGTENSALDPLATAMDYIYCIALGGPSIAIERGSIYHANFFMNDVFSSSPFSSKAEEQRKGERERERERVLTGRNGGMVDGHEAIEV